jgi:hypothetical protein
MLTQFTFLRSGQGYDILAIVETGVALADARIGETDHVTKSEDVVEWTHIDNENAKLEQALVEAHYLGLSMRALAANRDFRYAAATASVCELLIGWARFVGDRLQEGELPFSDGAASDRRAHAGKL